MQRKLFLFICVLLFINFIATSDECHSYSFESDDAPPWVEVTFWGIAAALTAWHFFYSSGIDSINTNYTTYDSSSYALKYLLSGDSLTQFLELSSDQERTEFIQKFWDKFDPYAFDSQNEVRDEFEKRLFYANKYYSNKMKKGWRSARGRIHILYGSPDEKIVLPFQESFFQPPYDQQYTDLEIWIYDKPGGIQENPVSLPFIQGRRFFLFARFKGEYDHEQIYSSEPEELNQEYLFIKPINESR